MGLFEGAMGASASSSLKNESIRRRLPPLSFPLVDDGDRLIKISASRIDS